MKHMFFLVLLFSFQLSVSAQGNSDSFVHVKKGIYFSSEEIRNNSPSITDSFQVVERSKSSVFWVGGGEYTFELLSSDSLRYKKIRKTFVGISDGQYFYISHRLIDGSFLSMTRCLLTGPYLVAPIEGNLGQYTGGGIIPSLIKIKSGFLIDFKDGTSRKLSNDLIKQELKDYPELQKEFSKRGNLLERAVEIFSKVNELENNR